MMMDQEKVRRMCQVLGIPQEATVQLGSPFPDVLPGADGHTARLEREDDGYILYVSQAMGKEISLSLVRVMIARAYKTLEKVVDKPTRRRSEQVGKPEYVTWSLRLLVDAGIVEPAEVSVPELPKGLNDSVGRVWKGYKHLLQCRWLYEYGQPAPFSFRFGAVWCGLSHQTVSKAVAQLMAANMMARVKEYKSQYGTKVGLFLPGSGLPICAEHYAQQTDCQVCYPSEEELAAAARLLEGLDIPEDGERRRAQAGPDDISAAGVASM